MRANARRYWRIEDRGSRRCFPASTADPSRRSCRRENSSNDAIAPHRQVNMSHCVSQGSPWVGEGGVGIGAEGQRAPPFDQFEEGREAQARGQHQVRQPTAATQRREPQQQFAREDRRHEALHPVADAIPRVARGVQQVLQPQPRRRLRMV